MPRFSEPCTSMCSHPLGFHAISWVVILSSIDANAGDQVPATIVGGFRQSLYHLPASAFECVLVRVFGGHNSLSAGTIRMNKQFLYRDKESRDISLEKYSIAKH